ncbi:hypothetical protein NDU88_003574 [Pleurodeles waltl]|uniref:Uncharacterized protein n=1 Tax=Pleurodeles waltl TaxID=8319 RepID=A0AAV7W2K8_PLEWA|nr:hypothetical protein NDU88_003574 [Pleurodeles waltl]
MVPVGALSVFGLAIRPLRSWGWSQGGRPSGGPTLPILNLGECCVPQSRAKRHGVACPQGRAQVSPQQPMNPVHAVPSPQRGTSVLRYSSLSAAPAGPFKGKHPTTGPGPSGTGMVWPDMCRQYAAPGVRCSCASAHGTAQPSLFWGAEHSLPPRIDVRYSYWWRPYCHGP